MQDDVRFAPDGTEFLCDIPKEAGKYLNMTLCNGVLIVLCENGSYELIDGELIPIEIDSWKVE